MRGQKKRNITDTNVQKLMVQSKNCEAVQENILELMDWVGTTERLSTETIPLLSKLLDVPQIRWENYRVLTNMREYVSFGRENVSSFAIQTIKEMSKLDSNLYSAVESRYQYLEMMA